VRIPEILEGMLGGNTEFRDRYFILDVDYKLYNLSYKTTILGVQSSREITYAGIGDVSLSIILLLSADPEVPGAIPGATKFSE
jgi:hypothetical protein